MTAQAAPGPTQPTDTSGSVATMLRRVFASRTHSGETVPAGEIAEPELANLTVPDTVAAFILEPHSPPTQMEDRLSLAGLAGWREAMTEATKVMGGLWSPPSGTQAPTRARVLDLLGRPELRRTEGRAEYWQYRSASCVLDLHFTEHTQEAPVRHAEIRPRRMGGAVTADGCISDLLAQRDSAT